MGLSLGRVELMEVERRWHNFPLLFLCFHAFAFGFGFWTAIVCLFA